MEAGSRFRPEAIHPGLRAARIMISRQDSHIDNSRAGAFSGLARYLSKLLRNQSASVKRGVQAQNHSQNQNFNGDGDRNSNDNPWPYATRRAAPVLAVVGDVACQPGETEPSGEKG
jgi:hypothetical protein